ncbi:hypothetical protein RA2_04058 [Roseovarius sp. A-2]|uniref:hypothetical protein n=1 Tax=Roseovarius sp. A-2 TaxID=1570360 RepID=UPI0009C541D1|nr:hypothetical protein [Roseovarius sp. A-2]GAW36983.1 hypothetical protein RA2_04058 [Roseovarius sp. A-2]
MRLRDLFFVRESMPLDEWRDLGASVVDLEIALIDREEAVEKLTRANSEIQILETQINQKKRKYGVGP